jgi:hypothetical protein
MPSSSCTAAVIKLCLSDNKKFWRLLYIFPECHEQQIDRAFQIFNSLRTT